MLCILVYLLPLGPLNGTFLNLVICHIVGKACCYLSILCIADVLLPTLPIGRNVSKFRGDLSHDIFLERLETTHPCYALPKPRTLHPGVRFIYLVEAFHVEINYMIYRWKGLCPFMHVIHLLSFSTYLASTVNIFLSWPMSLHITYC